MIRDTQIKITAKANGDFEIVATEVEGITLITACAGLTKETAKYLGQSEVALLKAMLEVAEKEAKEI